MNTFLALGDSYTLGEAVAAHESWPALLVQGLRNRGMEIAQPQIIAQTGWTTADLRRALEESDLASPYDLVSLLIGVNNQYQGLPVADYASDFELLIRQAIALSGMRQERVFVLSIPDWGVTPFAADRDRQAIAAEIDALNQINARLSYQYGVQYVNLTSLSREAGKFASLNASDGLHPSVDMYRRWVDLLMDRVRRELMNRVIRPGQTL